MAKQTGEIIGSVRIGKTTFKAGQEEEFAAAASAAQIAHLTKKGAIKGEFGQQSKSPAPAAPPATDVTEDAQIFETETPTETTKTPKGKGKKS